MVQINNFSSTQKNPKFFVSKKNQSYESTYSHLNGIETYYSKLSKWTPKAIASKKSKLLIDIQFNAINNRHSKPFVTKKSNKEKLKPTCSN